MRIGLTPIIALGIATGLAPAETRTSPSYTVGAESQDAGGQRGASANYTADSSIGGIGGVSAADLPPEVLKSGYVGQLYEPVSLAISASPTNVNEGTSRELTAAQALDDGTVLLLAGAEVTWSVVAGPIASISANGLAVAKHVYQDTPAAVSGAADGLSSSLGLLVANVTFDDFGLYAGDGVDDDWQVFYFGEENPEANPGRDPDRDGRDNLSESIALTIPTDPTSLFQLRAMPTPGQPGNVDLVFGPIRPERTYTVLSSPDLSGVNWRTLSGAPHSDHGDDRTVTDTDISAPRKFYRIEIGR